MSDEVAANWTRAILVCARCSRRVGGGWGAKGRTPLAKALRRALGVSKGQCARVGVVEVGCLGACPAQGVVVLDGARPGRWVVARPGETPAAVLAALDAPTPAVDPVLAPTSLADWRAVLRPGVEG